MLGKTKRCSGVKTGITFTFTFFGITFSKTNGHSPSGKVLTDNRKRLFERVFGWSSDVTRTLLTPLADISALLTSCRIGPFPVVSQIVELLMIGRYLRFSKF